MCIIWSILAYKFPVAKDKQRISKYVDHLNSIIIPSFDFPYNYNNIKKLHKLNNVDFDIFEIDEDKRIKEIIFKSHNNYKGCNRLLYKNHYLLCTKISTIIRNSNRMSYPCLNCLTSYSSEQILENHKLMCEEHKATKIVPFTIYCGIESFNTESSTQKPFCYNNVIKLSYPDLMEEHEVTYMGKDCGEYLANTII